MKPFVTVMALLISGLHSSMAWADWISLSKPPPPTYSTIEGLVTLSCDTETERWDLDCTTADRDDICTLHQVKEVIGPCKARYSDNLLLSESRLDGAPSRPYEDIPAGRHTVEHMGWIRLAERSTDLGPGQIHNPLRHFWLADDRHKKTWSADLKPTPMDFRMKGYRMDITLKAPEGSKVLGSNGLSWNREGAVWRATFGQQTNKTAFIGESIGGFTVTRPGRAFQWGGVLIGLGGLQRAVAGARQEWQFVFRGEYEVALWDNWFPGIGVDIVDDGPTILTPRIETVLLSGMVTLGAGMPIPLMGKSSVGLRLISGFGLGPLWCMVHFDVFSDATRPEEFGILGRFSF
jgi:hypothetical protein